MNVWQMTRRWHGAAVRTLIVVGGVGAAAVTIAARRTGDWELARLGAIASLVFVVLMVVFVVPPLSRSARAEAAQLDLPFQVTAGGLVFVGIFLVVAFAAWNTGNNLLFLIFSVLTSALFVAWSAARASLRDLIVSARFPDHIFAGEAAPVIVTLHNTKRLLPSFSILIEARSRLAEERDGRRRRRFVRGRRRFTKRVLAYFMYVPHRARAEQRVVQTFTARGHVLITGFELSTRFPFGFFRLRRRLRARDVELIIYPKPKPASDELHLLPMNAGQIASARRGAGHDLYGLRDYLPQDDVRHIDWKATARSSRLMVREFAAEDERRVHIVLDTSARADEEPGKNEKAERNAGGNVGRRDGDARARFEHGVTLAASFVAHFIDERADVCLTLGEEVGAYGAGREHLYASLRRLALVEAETARTNDRQQHEFWQRIVPPSPATLANYVILLTTAAPGSIPSHVWRNSHVIYL